MKEYPLVSIITVNYNGKKYLKDCFNSLYNLNYPPNKLEIIMVDNNSSDSSAEFVKENFPRVKIIKNNINNYCKANNLGIKSAKGKYIAILNNDTKVDKNWLIELVKIINQDKSIGAVTSKILFFDGRLQSTGHYEFPYFYWSDRGFKEDDKGQYDELEEVPSISHCATLYRKRCFNNVGLLDEDFSMYMEDVDMSIRAKQKGWRLFYVPKSIAYHKFHGSIEDSLTNFYCERNRLLLIAKHYPLELSRALFGKGYFTVLNKKSELMKILPSVFSKLIRHHNTEIVISTLPTIFENLNKILNLEKDYLIKQLDLQKNQTDLLKEALSQKDQLLQQKDIELSGLKAKINQDFNLLSQKDQLLQQKDIELSNLKAKINQDFNLLSQKDQLLQQKDIELSNLKAKINQDFNLLSQKDTEISHLKEEINLIYHSQTYRFIVQPVWKVLNFLKRIKAVFQYKKPHLFSSSQDRKNLCLAYFSAQSGFVNYKGPNWYIIKITNDTQQDRLVNVKIKIEYNNIVYAYFTKILNIEYKDSTKVVINYDWQKKAVFYINKQELKPDEFWSIDFEYSGFYSISAILFDNTNIQIDNLAISQKLEL